MIAYGDKNLGAGHPASQAGAATATGSEAGMQLIWPPDTRGAAQAWMRMQRGEIDSGE